jgi:RNA polymerase sigma factor for flagellar operon FliA
MLAELWWRYKNLGNVDAKERLILECLPIVKSLAQRFSIYTSSCYDIDDLMSVGIIGLLDALEKYDPVMRTSFKTYAKYRIRGAILDEMRNLKWTPRSIQEKIQSLKRAYNHLEQSLSRTPTEIELADAMGLDLKQFHKVLVQIGPATLVALSQKCYEGKESTSLETLIEDPNAVNPEEKVESEEVRYMLADAIRDLPEREKIVITLYYYEEMTMREIGDVLSLTESRICQIHATALLHLFQALRPKIKENEEFVTHQATAE